MYYPIAFTKRCFVIKCDNNSANVGWYNWQFAGFQEKTTTYFKQMVTADHSYSYGFDYIAIGY